MGERLNGIQEVRGSIPRGSTKIKDNLNMSGATWRLLHLDQKITNGFGTERRDLYPHARPAPPVHPSTPSPSIVRSQCDELTVPGWHI